MSAEKVTYSLLSTTSAITDIVSTRIYPVFPTQDGARTNEVVSPFVVYTLQGTDKPGRTLNDGAGPVYSTITLDYWELSYSNLKTLGDAIESAFDDVGNTTIAGNLVQLIAQQDRSDTEETFDDSVVFHGNQNYTVII